MVTPHEKVAEMNFREQQDKENKWRDAMLQTCNELQSSLISRQYGWVKVKIGVLDFQLKKMKESGVID